MSRAKRLEGQVALVTGASRGIGAAIASELADEGASVVVNYARSAKPAEELVAAIAARGGRARAVHADVTDDAQLARLFAEAKVAYGRLDVLVNNAGWGEFRPLAEIDDQHYRGQFDLNVRALLFATKHALALFPEKGGRIVNVGSISGHSGMANCSVYAGTKAAVEGITISLAAELGPRGITVNLVAPGPVDTDLLHSALQPGMAEQMASMTPLRRIGTPADVAKVVAFLASAESGWLTGQVIDAAGGMRM